MSVRERENVWKNESFNIWIRNENVEQRKRIPNDWPRF